MREVFSFKKDYAPRMIFRIFNFIFMLVVSLAMLIPVLKVLSDSFDRTTVYGINLWPKYPSIDAYKTIFTNKPLYKPFLISLITTASGTALGLLMTTLGAYVLIQKKLIGRAFLAKFIFITMIFSGGLIPTFVTLKSLHLINTLWAVLLPASINVFNMILMRNFFEQIPQSIFESAEMDGCPPPILFAKIVLPLSTSALAAIGLFFAVQYWNEFFAYVMYISDTKLYNFQIKLRELILSEQNINDQATMGYGSMVKNAAVFVAIVPFMVIYPFCQRYFIIGVTMGAVKE
jgi:putative aldouronate transport system permease protein